MAVVSRNEGQLLKGCLASVVGVDRLLVLDMESMDDTREVAQSYGADVISVPHVPIVERIRQRAFPAVKTDWLLWLDPDERAPGGDLKALLGPFLDSSVSAYWVPFVDVAFGYCVPTFTAGAAKIVLVRRHSATWRTDAPAHMQPQIDGDVASLVGRIPPFKHFAYRSLEQSLEKSARYARTGGSLVSKDPSDPFLLPKLMWGVYVQRRAWRDGTAGTVAANLTAIGDYLAHVHRWEAAGYPQTHVSGRSAVALTLARRVSNWSWRLRQLRRTNDHS